MFQHIIELTETKDSSNESITVKFLFNPGGVIIWDDYVTFAINACYLFYYYENMNDKIKSAANGFYKVECITDKRVNDYILSHNGIRIYLSEANFEELRRNVFEFADHFNIEEPHQEIRYIEREKVVERVLHVARFDLSLAACSVGIFLGYWL